MLNWFKKKLRDWILEDNEPPSRELEVYVKGHIEKVTAIQQIGLYLRCVCRDGAECLINSEKSRDTKVFNKLWKHMGGKKMTWEDGTPYEMD